MRLEFVCFQFALLLKDLLFKRPLQKQCLGWFVPDISQALTFVLPFILFCYNRKRVKSLRDCVSVDDPEEY